MALNLSGVQEQTESVKQGTSEKITKNYLDTHSSSESLVKLVFMHVASLTGSNFSRCVITVISSLHMF